MTLNNTPTAIAKLIRCNDCNSMEELVRSIKSIAPKSMDIGFNVIDQCAEALPLAVLAAYDSPMIKGIEGSGIIINFDSTHSNQREHNLNKVRCSACKSYGHKVMDCMKNFDEKSPARNSSSQMSTNNIFESDNESTVFLAVNSSCVSNMDNWYVDSGAANHFTMRNDWMEDFKTPKVKEIVLANKCQGNSVLISIEINGSEIVGKNKSSSIENGIEIDLKDDESNLKLETELKSVRNPPLKRSDMPTKPINSLAVLLYTTESMGDLMDVEEAINCPDSELWRKGNMINIFNSLQENEILGSTEMPPDCKTIGVKCVFREKRYVKRIMRYLKGPISAKYGYSDQSIKLELLPTVELLNNLVQLTLANRVLVKQREYSANETKKVRQLLKLFVFHLRMINMVINQHSMRRYISGGHPCLELGTEFMTSDILTLTKPLIKLKRLKFTLIMGLFI